MKPLSLHRASLAAIAVVLLGACDGQVPRPEAGYYSLATVNGQPVPLPVQPSVGFTMPITRGDLLLRSNQTFVHGASGIMFGGISTGTYRRAGNDLTLLLQQPGGGPQQITGSVFGDSVVLNVPGLNPAPMRYSYRRTQRPSGQEMSGTYLLTNVNGRTGQPPMVVQDTVINGSRYVTTVADSITFIENLFFRRTRFEQTIVTDPQGLPSASAHEWTSDGAFDRYTGGLRLEFYFPPPLPAARRIDSLTVDGNALVRRTALITGMHEERYTRR